MSEKDTGGIINGICKTYAWMMTPISRVNKPKHHSEYSVWNYNHYKNEVAPFAADPIIHPDSKSTEKHYAVR